MARPSVRHRFRDGVLLGAAVAMVAYVTLLDHRPTAPERAMAPGTIGDGAARFDVRRVAEADLRADAP